MPVKKFCSQAYNGKYSELMKETLADAPRRGRKSPIERERHAQKSAIRYALAEALGKFPGSDAAEIWRYVHEAHIARKAGLELTTHQLEAAASAENSWKKSSGHAFEEFIRDQAAPVLQPHGLHLFLQRDLHSLMVENKLGNEPPDRKWLQAQVGDGNFDLFAAIRDRDRFRVFGCLQCKTSIRDRVSRDREFSVAAMGHFFWSAAIVLDGGFLRLPKFINMVAGGGTFSGNGWHGVYVLSRVAPSRRVYQATLPTLEPLVSHARGAAGRWQAQRQWMNADWDAGQAE